MPSLRASIDLLAGLPRLRALLSFLPVSWLEAAAQPASFVVAVNLEGEVVHNLQDQNNPFHYITGVTPCGDTLVSRQSANRRHWARTEPVYPP